MNQHGTGPKLGIQTTEFWTWAVSIVTAIALAKGWITQGQADAANSQAATIGATVIIVVTSAAYILNRFGLKLPWMQVLAYSAPVLNQNVGLHEDVSATQPVPADAPAPTTTPPANAGSPTQTVRTVAATPAAPADAT
jgi:hypothetical protein